MDYNAIAKKYGAINSISPTSTSSKVDYSALAQKFGGTDSQPAQVATPTPQSGGSTIGNFVKGIVSAPATLIARPFQAIAEFAGASSESVDAFSNKYSGGLVAPVPQNTSDIVKDFGRGIQTVALGAGAPLASGAAFGFGSSLENQGSDIASIPGVTNALVSTLAGMGAGKALDLIGKPLINAAGKVIGTITPKTLQDVVSKGSEAVSNFMAHHEIVPTATKPVINAIPKIAEKIDSKVGSLFTGAGNKVKSAIQSQYPDATKENIAKHYENVEIKQLFKPVTEPGPRFKDATNIVQDAKKKGIDLEKIAADNKIYFKDHINGKNFDTQASADALSSETMRNGPDIIRPSLAAAEPGVQRVPISDIKNEILVRLSEVPDAKLSPEQKLDFAKKITEEYGDASVSAASHPNGYSLTNLYDSKLQTSSGLYKTPKNGGVPTISDQLTSKQKQIESQAFDYILRKNTPKEVGLDDYFKAQEGRFALANYLRSLDNKIAPQTLFQRGVKRAAQLGGATTGASVAGPFGMFSGYQFGGILADSFAKIPNPGKIYFLKSIGKTEPEIYVIMKQFTSEANIAKELRKALPKPSNVNAGISKVQNEDGAIPMGYPTHVPDKFNNDLTQNLQIANNTRRLPAPTTIYQSPTQGGKAFTPNRLFGTTPVVETKPTRIFKNKKK